MAGCFHLAWLDGTINTATGTITVDLPFKTRDEIGRLVAEDFVPGALLTPYESAGFSIAACVQAVVTVASVCDFINGWTPYATAPRVDLGVGPADADPASVEYGAKTTLNGNNFSGVVNGLGDENNAVFVRACNGVECSYAAKVVG